MPFLASSSYLVEERGLRPASIYQYRHHLDRFAAYLGRIGVRSIGELSPTILSAYIAERAGAGLAKSDGARQCGVLRVFLRYAHREGVLGRDLSGAVGVAAGLPTVGHPAVDLLGRRRASARRQSIAAPRAGRRDYAILLLLVTYGLRGREVAALTLDDIDWKRERLADPGAQGRAFDRVPVVARCRRGDRRLPPARPTQTQRPARVLPRAGAGQPDRRGRGVLLRSRTTCCGPGSRFPDRDRTRCATSAVQRLVDADFSLKTIGDFVGHRSPAPPRSTPRSPSRRCVEVALGDGEEVLAMSRGPGHRCRATSSRTSGRWAASTAPRRPTLRLLVRFAAISTARPARPAHSAVARRLPRVAAQAASREASTTSLGVVALAFSTGR